MPTGPALYSSSHDGVSVGTCAHPTPHSAAATNGGARSPSPVAGAALRRQCQFGSPSPRNPVASNSASEAPIPPKATRVRLNSTATAQGPLSRSAKIVGDQAVHATRGTGTCRRRMLSAAAPNAAQTCRLVPRRTAGDAICRLLRQRRAWRCCNGDAGPSIKPHESRCSRFCKLASVLLGIRARPHARSARRWTLASLSPSATMVG